MMHTLKTFVLLVATWLASASPAFAQGYPPCTQLPEPAWYEAATTNFDVVYPFRLQRSVPAKALYLSALCGARPATIWHLIDSGEGAIVEVPDALAASLDVAVPNLPRVDYMYVRGGGRDREAIVVLFTNGYSGPFFSFDKNLAWERAEVDRAAFYWNEVPYEFMRRASLWLHDAARFDQTYSVHTEAFGGLVQISFFDMHGGRALANPMGAMLVGGNPARDTEQMWIHELGHYNHYYFSGANGIPWVDDFSSITRHNRTILGVAIPFWFGQNFADSESYDCSDWSERPFGYVSGYARCGEMGATEDFADTAMLAVGVTQKLRERGHAGDWRFLSYRDCEDCFSPWALYGQNGEEDATVMGQKAAFFREHYTFHPWLAQDADGDGYGWQPGSETADHDDTNPVIGLKDGVYCESDAECDDNNTCTVDICTGGGCRYVPVDADGDGAADAMCGGTDCDDSDPTIGPGSERACTSACGATGRSICTGGAWTQCDAPTTCVCTPGETETVPCAMCGTAVRTCQPDGTWSDLSACGGQGVCEPGTQMEVDCANRMCGDGANARSIDRSRIDVCAATCEWTIGQCELLEPIEPEVCNSKDDDCDGAVDEGCADQLALIPGSSSGFYGGGGGSLQIGSCPAGYALAGMRLTQGNYNVLVTSYDVVAGIEPLCRKIELETSTSASGELTYAIGGSTNKRLSGHGQTPHYHADFVCPADQYVVRARVFTGRFVDTLKLRCASFEVTGDRGAYDVTRTYKNWSDEWFGTATNTEWGCPAGQVMTGIRTRNASLVDAIAFDCSDVAVTVQ
jgi:hypothetical protein